MAMANATTAAETEHATGSEFSAASKIIPEEKDETDAVVLDNQYFFEDEIFRIDKKGRVRFGLVVETSESFSGDEDDGVDDILTKGEVRVAWYPGGNENVHVEQTIGLADRTLMPGDVVRRLVLGKDTQRGYCREISMCADVKIVGTEFVIRNVVAERLRWISNWQRDSAVCLDSWVGSTKEFEERAVLRANSGTRIEITSSDFYVFKDRNCRSTGGIYSSQIFYPGNIVYGRLPSLENVKLLTPEIPMNLSKKGKPLSEKYLVESVYTDTVWVQWQCKALSDEGDIQSSTLEHPKPSVSGEELKRLKRLNLFESCMLQINDRNYLKYSLHDAVEPKTDWEAEQAAKFKVIFNQQQKEENQNLFVCTGGGANTSAHHFEKSKKKLNLIDMDKTAKSKKSSLKDKMNTSNKEKVPTQETSSDNSSTNRFTETSSQSEVWISDDCEEEDENDGDSSKLDEGAGSVGTSASVSTNSSPLSSPLHYKRRQTRRKVLKKLMKPAALQPPPKLEPKEGDELVTEALLVYSTVTVVWQDGTIESNIPSTELYPIHHLDNHEFFPGDFVIADKEECDVSYRDYGVIQKVDHHGRTAHVKWFTTYACTEEPKPAYKGESEVSVYDLKDHPDFQYRPGTMVIRVANFLGEDATCTAGQIIDNFIDGRVKVWWVDGHISMSWPQDLFEVGQYDHADWAHDSEDSWETESENSDDGAGSVSSGTLPVAESYILTNIERARVAIARLEEIFGISPNLQNGEVMRKLLGVYKACRYLDRLLNTNFFHEDNFMGLIERVRKGGTLTISERALDRKNRLFSDIQITSPNAKQQAHPCLYQAIVAVNSGHKPQSTISHNTTKEYAPKVLLNLSSTPFKYAASNTSVGSAGAARSNMTAEKSSDLHNTLTPQSTPEAANTTTFSVPSKKAELTPRKQIAINIEKNQLLNSAMLNIEKASEKTSQLKPLKTPVFTKDDSGNYSRNENCDVTCDTTASNDSCCELPSADPSTSMAKANDDMKSPSCCSIEIAQDAGDLVCVRLCTLLKNQLVNCINEIRLKYYKENNLNLSDIFDSKIEDTSVDSTAEANDTVEESDVNTEAHCSDVTEEMTGVVSSSTSTVAMSTSPFIVPAECFQVLSSAPKSHKYHLTIFHPNNSQQYYKAIQREHRMLKSSLPPGVWVRVFEDRMDLLSVMMEGPKMTPYEDGLFFFDIQLGREYPKSPPLCHYISYCTDRLNPNLYEDGKVCVSLLGTWSGRDTETWGANSTLLQVLVSIQGLILVPEPYFNEAGYEKQKGSQQGKENSRMYNEMVIIKMVQATTKLIQQPPDMFSHEILEHFKLTGHSMYERIKGWMELSNMMQNSVDKTQPKKAAIETQQDTATCCDVATNLYTQPEFPLVPASRGFCLTLAGLLQTLKSKLDTLVDNSNEGEQT